MSCYGCATVEWAAFEAKEAQEAYDYSQKGWKYQSVEDAAHHLQEKSVLDKSEESSPRFRWNPLKEAIRAAEAAEEEEDSRRPQEEQSVRTEDDDQPSANPVHVYVFQCAMCRKWIRIGRRCKRVDGMIVCLRCWEKAKPPDEPDEVEAENDSGGRYADCDPGKIQDEQGGGRSAAASPVSPGVVLELPDSPAWSEPTFEAKEVASPTSSVVYWNWSEDSRARMGEVRRFAELRSVASMNLEMSSSSMCQTSQLASQ